MVPEVALDGERELQGLGRRRVLAEGAEPEVAAREAGREHAPRGVGEAPLHAELLDQLGGEAAAEDRVGHLRRQVVRVAALDRHVAETDLRLGRVGLVDEQQAARRHRLRRRGAERDAVGTRAPAAEGVAQAGHRVRG
ncbi:MAG: hypothetical protein E6J69_16800 [Deltaproteobacteria bacterium]|nr:MAG: hypothetical protein E6J69_16800 [Deltaproteobacteria bacterium]